MKIVQARKAGFCFGVKRAIELAEQESAQGPICSWGPLIHNVQVVKSLAAKGVTVVNSLDEVEQGKKLVIRSHGAPPQIFAESESLGIQIVDATCPFVKKAQSRAWEASKLGFVVIVGDPNHPEVQGLLGWAGQNALVVSTLSEAQQLPHYPTLSIIAQTTLSRSKFDVIVEELRKHTDNLIVNDTICLATHERQKAAAELAEVADVMIVVGSQTSSNTRQLADICARKTKTYLIDTASDLHDFWFHGCRTAGLTAGASTPDWIIEEVIKKMSEGLFTQEISAPDTAAAQETSAGAASEPISDTGAGLPQTAGPAPQKSSAQESPVQENSAQTSASQESTQESASQETLAEDEFPNTMEGYAGSLPQLYKGALVSGAVVKISNDEVYIDLSWKSEGVIPLAELAFTKTSHPEDVVKLGDIVSAVVLRVENEEGHPILSRRRAAEIEAREHLAKAFANKEEIRAKVIECVKGGLLVDLGMRGFVPASQIQPGFVEDLSVFIGQELRLRVLEYDESKKKLVLSQKVILNEERELKRAEILANLKVGDVVEGVVQRLTKFGAFVDIGGIDALLHISDMAFSRIQHPSEVVSVNSTIKCKILSVDAAAGKISLGLKQLKPNPWEEVTDKYPIGSTVEGTVVRIAPFGAFVQLEDGVDALVHISQLAPQRIPKVEDVVHVGQVISAKVIECKPEEKRMSLSIRDYILEQNPGAALTQQGSQQPTVGEPAPAAELSQTQQLTAKLAVTEIPDAKPSAVEPSIAESSVEESVADTPVAEPPAGESSSEKPAENEPEKQPEDTPAPSTSQ